jgi:hypothetical protein
MKLGLFVPPDVGSWSGSEPEPPPILAWEQMILLATSAGALLWVGLLSALFWVAGVTVWQGVEGAGTGR